MAPDRFDQLLAAARQGEETAWAEIYADLAPAVLGYLRGSRAPDPEDVLGETFFQVARDLAGFKGEWSGFRGWVFTVAHHRLLDARRYASRRPVDPVAQLPEPGAPPGRDASDEAFARISAEQAQRVLDGLSPDQRDVLLLRIIGDLSIEQVAKALGKRPGAIKQLQRRGLAALRRVLEKGGVTR